MNSRLIHLYVNIKLILLWKVLQKNSANFIMEGFSIFSFLIIFQIGLFKSVSLVMLLHIVSLYESPDCN